MSTAHQQQDLIDQLLLRLVSLSNGSIQTLLDNVFTFLRQRSDFFDLQTPDRPDLGFRPGQAESLLLTAFHKQWAIKAAARSAATTAATANILADRFQNTPVANSPPKRSLCGAQVAPDNSESTATKATTPLPRQNPVPAETQIALDTNVCQQERSAECRLESTNCPPEKSRFGQRLPELGRCEGGESPHSMDSESGGRLSMDPGRTPTIDVKNGGRTDLYFWGQTAKEIEIEFPLRRGCLSKDVRVRCGTEWLTISVPSCRMNLAYSTMLPIIADELIWELDRKPSPNSSSSSAPSPATRSTYFYSLIITLSKCKVPSWWNCVFKEDEHKYPPPTNMRQEIAYQDLDLQGQLGVQKAIQQHQTKTTKDEQLLQQALQVNADKPNFPWATELPNL